jgi:hypothetical protein
MKKTILLTILLMLFLTNHAIIRCSSAPTTINIDGQLTEWDLNTSFDLGGLRAMVSSDDKYLYLGLAATDMRTRMRLMRNGFTILFKDKRKSTLQNGISVMPALQEIQVLMDNPTGAEEFQPKSDKIPESDFNNIKVLIDNRSVDLKTAVLNKVEYKESPEALTFEIAIPYNKYLPESLTLDTEKGKTLSVGLKINTRERPDMKHQDRTKGSPEPGNRSGKGFEGGRPGPDNGMTPSMGMERQDKGPSDSTRWVKFKL